MFQLKDKLVKFKDLDVKNEHKAIFMETVLSQLFYKLKITNFVGCKKLTIRVYLNKNAYKSS